MKIKNLLMGASVLVSTALTPLASQAAVALFPQSTDQDLVNFGSNSLFHDVYRFEAKREIQQAVRVGSCTAVRVDLELGYPVYLTAAHCLEGVKSIDVQGINGDLQPTRFLVHPNYKTNPLDDLAAFWNPQQKGHLGYALYQEPLSASSTETFLHAGFGIMRSGKMPRQAFFTCPMNFEEDINLFSADCRKNTETTQVRGKVTHGDSGGVLLVQKEDDSVWPAGISHSVSGGDNIAHGKTGWRRIDKDFIQALKDVALTTQNAVSQEGGLQDDTALAHVESAHLLGNDPRVLLELGDQERRAGKYEEAMAFYRQAGNNGRRCVLSLIQAHDAEEGKREEVEAI